jgi:hypothetical protein
MYEQGDRVVVTSWQLDLQCTEVLQGTIVQVGKDNDLIIELDSGEIRHVHADEVQKLRP